MKIVHIVPFLAKGGGERVAVDLANWQVAKGHEVALVAGSRVDERLLRDDLDARVEVRYVAPRTGRFARYAAALGWLWRNRRWLDRRDIVHAHMTFPAVMATILHWRRRILRAAGPALVETYHAVGMPIPKWHRWLHSRMVTRRDALILMAEDPYWRRFVADRPSMLAKIIPNGLAEPVLAERDAAAVQAYRKAAGIPDDCRLLVGSIGRLAPARQPALYIPLFAEIVRALGPDVHFLMAGEGPELESLRALARDHGISGQVHFPGLATDSSLPRALIDLYVTIILGQVVGIAALEAAFASLPIVAFQLHQHRPAQPADWIWSSQDSHALALEAIRLLNDPAARGDLAARQSAYVRARHSLEAMGVAYESVYERVMFDAASRASLALVPGD